MQGGRTAELVLGFIDSSIYVIMPAVLRSFRSLHASVRVVIRGLISAEQIDLLERGEIQVGILRPVRVGPRLVIEEIGRERLVVALPKGHRLADLEQIRISDLKDEPLVFFRREFAPAVYDRIMGMFHTAGQTPDIAQEAGEQHTLLGLVAAGLGFSIGAEGMSHWGADAVIYRPLAHPSAWVPIGIAWRRSDHTDQVRWFVETARAYGASIGSGTATVRAARASTAPAKGRTPR